MICEFLWPFVNMDLVDAEIYLDFYNNLLLKNKYNIC